MLFFSAPGLAKGDYNVIPSETAGGSGVLESSRSGHLSSATQNLTGWPSRCPEQIPGAEYPVPGSFALRECSGLPGPVTGGVDEAISLVCNPHRGPKKDTTQFFPSELRPSYPDSI